LKLLKQFYRNKILYSLVQLKVPLNVVKFLVAGPPVWNCLPPEVTSATFHTQLKTLLSTESYPDIQLI